MRGATVIGPRRTARVLTAAAVGSVLVAGCSFAPPPRSPETVVALPDGWDAPRASGESQPVRWWRSFEDPTLDRLVEAALDANLDLREALARMEELRARYRIARAPLFPSISLNGDASRTSTPANTGLGGQLEEGGAVPDSVTGFGFSFPDRFDFTTYSASIGFAYELDFWGRLRNDGSAAVRDFLASRADAETVRLGVIASTVATYFEIATLRRQVALAAENVDLLGERADITEERYRRGLVDSFELYAIRQQFRNAQSEFPGLRSQLDDAEGRLAVILGRYAGQLEGLLPGELDPHPDPTPIPAGLPVTLLTSRPDVLAAAERMDAARLRVGARRAERLPTLSLNGAVGFQASDPANVFRPDQWFLNLVGGLVAPLFQGGRLVANVRVADAQYSQAMIGYARTVLNAYREVRTSLRAFDHARERYARVRDQVEEARASLGYQRERYRRGVGEYLAYLDARRNLVGAETTLAEAERGLAEARLAVHRALGGAWVESDDFAAASTTLDGGTP